MLERLVTWKSLGIREYLSAFRLKVGVRDTGVPATTNSSHLHVLELSNPSQAALRPVAILQRSHCETTISAISVGLF